MAPISVTLAPRDPPAAVVALVGEHDAYSAARVESELAWLLAEQRHIVLDLRETDFVDSTTLAVILASRRDAEERGLGFALVLPGRTYTQVHQLLELTNLRSAFAIYDTLDDALAAARDGVSASVRPAA
jgi:anti-anti-sigma factor